jgi:aminoglycoside phosphotransferase (APT) family kinase protein
MNLAPERIAWELRHTFPDLPQVKRIRPLAEGFGSRVFLLDDEYIFRIAKHAETGNGYEKEAAILPQLQGRLPFEIPRPLWHSPRAFTFGTIGYRRPPGVPFRLAIRSEVDLASIAHHLATFMVALHSIPRADLDLPEVTRRRLERLRDVTSPVLQDYLPLRQHQRLAAWWNEFLAKSQQAGPSAVIHGDLWAENLILNGTRDGLVGVVDFEAAAVDDVARDFAPLAYLGREFLDRVIADYQALGGRPGNDIMERVQDQLLLRELAGLQYALNQPEAQELGDSLRKIERLELLTP